MGDAPHLNQPGGRFRESVHENIAGRERELRSMADGVRRLIHITTANTASAERTRAAAEALHRLADELEPLVPDTPPPRYGLRTAPTEPHDYFPYDAVLGLYNPLALPIEMDWEEPRAIGRARFGTPYEGPPGCVHGAVIAGAFDQVFNVANLMRSVAGPTAELTLRYHKPTPLDRPLVFEAWVDRVEGRKVRTKGLVRFGETVTVEGEGLFISLAPDRVFDMAGSFRE